MNAEFFSLIFQRVLQIVSSLKKKLGDSQWPVENTLDHYEDS